jgi:hypothetical protein
MIRPTTRSKYFAKNPRISNNEINRNEETRHVNCYLPHMYLSIHPGVLHTDVLLEWAQSCHILTDILHSHAEGSWLPEASL